MEEIQVRGQNDILPHEARVNVTWSGQNGDLTAPVSLDATDGDVRSWAAEAVRTGTVPGIRQDANVNFQDFIVDRFPPNEHRPFSLIQLRPKTPFGV